MAENKSEPTTSEAMSSVLQAERDAAHALDLCRGDAAALVAQAQVQAQRISARCHHRIGRMHQHCSMQLQTMAQTYAARTRDELASAVHTATAAEIQRVVDALLDELGT